jgi:hypothetical protein
MTKIHATIYIFFSLKTNLFVYYTDIIIMAKLTLKDSSFIPLVQSDNNNYSLYLHQFLTCQCQYTIVLYFHSLAI